VAAWGRDNRSGGRWEHNRDHRYPGREGGRTGGRGGRTKDNRRFVPRQGASTTEAHGGNKGRSQEQAAAFDIGRTATAAVPLPSSAAGKHVQP